MQPSKVVLRQFIGRATWNKRNLRKATGTVQDFEPRIKEIPGDIKGKHQAHFTREAQLRFLSLLARTWSPWRHPRWWTYQWTDPATQSEVETRLSRTELLRRAIERCFQPTPHPSQRATRGAARSLDPFQFITHSPTCIILPATHFLLVSGGKFIGWGILTPFTF